MQHDAAVWDPGDDWHRDRWRQRRFELPPRPPAGHFGNEFLQEIEWRRCAADPLWFLARHWHCLTPDQGVIPFRPFDFQAHSLDLFSRHRLVLVLKARQIGYTALMAGYVLWYAMFNPASTVLYLSLRETDAEGVVKTLNNQGFALLPGWMTERVWQTNRAKALIELSNGSVIRSVPSQSNPARGQAASLIVADEWGFFPNPDEAWASMGPAVSVGGRAIALSSANGDGTPFSTQWRKARKGGSGWCPVFFGWWSRPDRDAAWHARETGDMEKWVAAQEHPGSEEEAFRAAGESAFDHQYLDGLPLRDPHEGALVESPHGPLWRDFHFERQPDDRLKIWSHPVPGGHERYVIGADVASGAGRDFSSAHVLEWGGRVVAHWHGQCYPDEFGDLLGLLGAYYGYAMIGVERNNVGLSTLRRLAEARYPNVFRQRTLDKAGNQVKAELGWYTTKSSKPVLVEDLAAAVRDRVFELPCEATADELRGYRSLGDGKYEGYPHDDRVISLGIALQMLPFATGQPVSAPFVPAERGTVAWWEQRAEQRRRDRAAEGPLLGGGPTMAAYAAARMKRGRDALV